MVLFQHGGKMSPNFEIPQLLDTIEKTMQRVARDARDAALEEAARVVEYDRRSPLAKKYSFSPKWFMVAQDLAALVRARKQQPAPPMVKTK